MIRPFYSPIKYINVGKSGQTPNDIGKLVKLSETMKQGFQYGDSQEQLQIASRINSKKFMALEKRLSSYSEAFKNAVLYIAPYFSASEIRGLPQILFEKNPNIENVLYPFLQRCHLPSHLCAEDFRRMSFADYQHLNEEDKANVSTVCKILNSSNEEQLENWLPSIPDEELALISLIQYPYSFGFQLKALTRLPVNELLSILYEQDVSQQSILIKSLSSSEVLKIIFERCPDKKSRFDVIVKTRNLLVEALSYPESLKILLDLYPTDEDCLEMIKQKDKFGECILFKAASHPESLKILLDLYPADEDRLEAIKEKNVIGQCMLFKAASHPESLKILLDLYPTDEDRLEAITEVDALGQSILFEVVSNLESLEIVLELYPTDKDRLEAIKEKDLRGQSILFKAASNSESLKMLIALLSPAYCIDVIKEEYKQNSCSILINAVSNVESLKIIFELFSLEDLLEIFKVKDKYDRSILFHAIKYPASLKMLLELYPIDKDRFRAIREKSHFGESVLFGATLNPESFRIILESLAPEVCLELLLEKDEEVLESSFSFFVDSKYKSGLEEAIHHPLILGIIFAVLSKQQQLGALLEKKVNGHAVLEFAFQDEKILQNLLEALPHTISLAIQAQIDECKTNLNDVLESRASIEQFIHQMHGYSTPDVINSFVEALIQNENIDFELEKLLSSNPGAEEFIKAQLNNLHDFWKQRLPTSPQLIFK